MAVVNPEDATKSSTKKMYYLACGFCRLTTRDVGVPDQTVGKLKVAMYNEVNEELFESCQ